MGGAGARFGCSVASNAGPAGRGGEEGHRGCGGGSVLAGRGSSSYIVVVIMRDEDANTAWTAASDATLEERRYYVQNWRADVDALLTAGGDVSEWVRYSGMQ